jgi:hypothetical protein
VREGFVSEAVFRSVGPTGMLAVAAATGKCLCAVLKTACDTKPSGATRIERRARVYL